MALFKKKKETPVNPYYNPTNLKAATPQPETSKPIEDSQIPTINKPAKITSIPLISVPKIKISDINLQPAKTAGISVLDALRMESSSKSTAFIRMNDFKKVLDDIKELEKRIAKSQADLEEYSKALELQKEYVKNYNLLVQDMRKMIERMSTYLSNVEE